MGRLARRRPRKHYRLSSTGRAAFAEQRRQWSVVSAALQQVWTERDGGRAFAPDRGIAPGLGGA